MLPTPIVQMTPFIHSDAMNCFASAPPIIVLATLSIAGNAQAQTWRTASSTDAFSDQRTVTASVSGRGFGMVVRCKDNLLETYFVGGYVGDDDANVRYRINGGEVHEDVWSSSTSKDSLFADAPGEVARWMAAGSRMAFEYEDFSGTPHQYAIPLNGSAVAIHQALDACGVPRTNPRAVDGEVWRRAVIEIDKMDRSVVSGLQHLLTLEGFSVEASGRRTQATYAALSSFYASYWQRCLADEALSSSCSSWRSLRRYNADADYPIEPISLLIEVNEFNKSKDARAVAPINAAAPEWSRRIHPEFPERALARGITTGAATLQCKASSNGSLSECSVISETPADAGFGQAALRAVRTGRLSPRTMDNTPAGSTVTFTTDFRLD